MSPVLAITLASVATLALASILTIYWTIQSARDHDLFVAEMEARINEAELEYLYRRMHEHSTSHPSPKA